MGDNFVPIIFAANQVYAATREGVPCHELQGDQVHQSRSDIAVLGLELNVDREL